ncbi:MAG: hypothetical protein AAFY88_22515 [Acidobacteriota bacterium]
MRHCFTLALALAVVGVILAGVTALAAPAEAFPIPKPATCPAPLCPTNLHGWTSLGTCSSDQGSGLELCELYRNIASNHLCRRACVYY